MHCVTAMRFSFLVRGISKGYLTPSRGLRQGDPLSLSTYSCLVLKASRPCSVLLQEKVVNGSLPAGIAICDSALVVNHLLFVDDSTLYAETSQRAFSVIQDVLDIYSKASGQVFSENVKAYLGIWWLSILMNIIWGCRLVWGGIKWRLFIILKTV